MRRGNEHSTFGGPLRAVIFDWAGTIVDYGSRAPAGVFVEVYRRHGVAISMAEARGPMGMQKRDHIEAIARMPGVADRWRAANGATLGGADIDTMYHEFLPLQLACLPDYADVIPGAIETFAACRARGMKIGTSTGYSRPLMDVVEAEARRRGLVPDLVVCADDVPAGRPAPWMCFENLKRLDAWPPAAAVKVDDTLPGIVAGMNAGMWTVGVALSGNEMGLAREEAAALLDAERDSRLRAADKRFVEAGSHYVIDSVADLIPVLDEIDARLKRGDRP